MTPMNSSLSRRQSIKGTLFLSQYLNIAGWSSCKLLKSTSCGNKLCCNFGSNYFTNIWCELSHCRFKEIQKFHPVFSKLHKLFTHFLYPRLFQVISKAMDTIRGSKFICNTVSYCQAHNGSICQADRHKLIMQKLLKTQWLFLDGTSFAFNLSIWLLNLLIS